MLVEMVNGGVLRPRDIMKPPIFRRARMWTVLAPSSDISVFLSSIVCALGSVGRLVPDGMPHTPANANPLLF